MALQDQVTINVDHLMQNFFCEMKLARFYFRYYIDAHHHAPSGVKYWCNLQFWSTKHGMDEKTYK